MEDKKEITEALLPVLQLTRGFSDLVSLEYDCNEYEEWVTAIFANGHTKIVNVTMDSGTTLISDIIRQAL